MKNSRQWSWEFQGPFFEKVMFIEKFNAWKIVILNKKMRKII